MAAQRFLILAVMALAGCGGGGGSSSSTATGWVAGVYPPSAGFAGQCTTLAENNFLRSWTNEYYLWFDEVVDRNPALWATPAYFDLLKTTATTPSGNPKDRFHFTFDTAAWNAFSQSGVSPGYGAELAVLSTLPPRRVVVAYTEPGSPASGASLARGAEILTVDGVDVVNDNTSGGVATLNAGLFPDAAGETHTFTLNCGAPSGFNQAVFASISAVDPSGPGFIRVWEDGQAEPTSATVLNYGNVGITTGVLIPLKFTTGTYRVKNFGGTTHQVIDHMGWLHN